MVQLDLPFGAAAEQARSQQDRAIQMSLVLDLYVQLMAKNAYPGMAPELFDDYADLALDAIEAFVRKTN